VEFVPLGLVGDEKVDDVVDIGDGADERSGGTSGNIEIAGAATGRRGDFFPS